MTPRTTPRRSKSSRRAATPAKPARPFVAHHLAPPHEILSLEESTRLIAELATPVERLPRIFETDPGLQTDPKYPALKESGEKLAGRLVRIRRTSATAGEAVAYRVISRPSGED